MTRNVNGIPTKLFSVKIILLVNCIEYIRFHEVNCDYDLAADPTSWDTTKTQFTEDHKETEKYCRIHTRAEKNV